MANLTLYTIVRRICHIKDSANRHTKAARSRFASRPRAPWPRAAQKKPACLRFKSRGFSIGAWGVYKPAGRWLAGFWATSPGRIKTQTYVIFARRRIRNACNPPSRARTPAASASRASGTRSFQTNASQAPTACRTARPSAPWHGPLVRVMHQALARRLPTMTAIHTPSAIALRVSTPQGAHDLPFMCVSVTHDPSCICTLDVHGSPYAARRTPGTSTPDVCSLPNAPPLAPTVSPAAHQTLATSSVRPCRAARCTGRRRPRGRGRHLRSR